MWMVSGREIGMDVLLVALAARMTRFAVGKRQPEPFISFSSSRCALTMGQRDLSYRSRVATSLRTPVSSLISCGALVVGRMLFPTHLRNQTYTCLSTWSDSGTAMICGDFNVTAWRKVKTLFQSAAMVSNILALSLCCLFPYLLYPILQS